MPSFIASLSGLLAILGMQLYILGPTGSINLPYASPLVSFGQILIMPAWLSHALALVPGLVLILSGTSAMRRRRAAGLTAAPMAFLLVKALALTALLEVGVYYLNLGRGVPWMFGFFVLLVVVLNYALTRTKWGRSMFAVGGNREAARRSGINVAPHLHLGLRAVLNARSSRRHSLGFAAGDIQPAGGHRRRQPERDRRGGHRRNQPVRRARQRLFGATRHHRHPGDLKRTDTAEPSSSLRYMITGGVLAIAVIVNSLARRSRVSHGRA